MISSHHPVKDAVLACIKEAGMAGTDSAAVEAKGFSRNSACAALVALARQGVIFRGARGHRTVRYFGCAEWARGYEMKRTARQRESNGLRKPGSDLPIPKPQSRAPWPPDTLPVFPRDAHGRPLFKHTVAPTPEPALRTNTHWQF